MLSPRERVEQIMKSEPERKGLRSSEINIHARTETKKEKEKRRKKWGELIILNNGGD